MPDTFESDLEASEIEVLQALAARAVRYVVIGSWALGYYGVERFRKDLDIVVEASEANARRLLEALTDLRITGHRFTVENLSQSGKKITLERHLVEIFTSVEGFSFDELLSGSRSINVGDLHIPIPCGPLLLRLKGVSKRPKDRRDHKKLRKKLGRLSLTDGGEPCSKSNDAV